MNKKRNLFYIICLTLISLIMSIGIGTCICGYKVVKAEDRELYYYGLNNYYGLKCFEKYNPIAGHIEPVCGAHAQRWLGVDGFSFLCDNQYFIYKGSKDGDLVIDSICSYGFNDHMLVTEVVTDKGIKYYDVADFEDFHHSTEIQIDTCCITNPMAYFHLDRWVYDVNNPPQTLCKILNFTYDLFFIILLNEILLLILFIMMVVKIIKLNSTNKCNFCIRK